MHLHRLFLFATAAIAETLSSASQPIAPSSPTSNVTGLYFDRFITIWLENTDYEKAAGDPNLKWIAKHGVTLDNYFAVTHPSMPNYMAAVGGDYFGLNHDHYTELPANVSSIVDILEDAGISWGSYMEGMPYTGFTGRSFRNPMTKANMYVRKHNPLVLFSSVTQRPERLARIKNMTLFHEDLVNERLPQWMFISPNMTNDGHDTSVTYAGAWARSFLEPLLENEYFMKRTLILLTFDENHTYSAQNRVFSILLGGAIPDFLHKVHSLYLHTHYSGISTVTANWDLPTLGRYDVGAEVFYMVANYTGDFAAWPERELAKIYLNASYPGIFNNKEWAPQPAPNISAVVNGRKVSENIRKMWQGRENTTYRNQNAVPDKRYPPVYRRNKAYNDTSESAGLESGRISVPWVVLFSFAIAGAEWLW